MQLIADLDTGQIAPQRTGLDLIDDVIAAHQPVAVLALFSGGHDSLVNTHLTAQHPAFTAVAHINTGIGIPETTAYVRETCKRMGWPLLEGHAKVRYEDLCLKRGLPGGPVHHQMMYHRLKSEVLQTVVRSVKGKPRDVVLLSTGVRHSESARRMRIHAIPSRRDRMGAWANPIFRFTASDVNAYIAAHGLPRNPVVDKLHRSGECLCGALADPNEIKEIDFWYPEVGQRIHTLERQCFELGLPYQWGSKQVKPPKEGQVFMPMCQSCELRWDDGGR